MGNQNRNLLLISFAAVAVGLISSAPVDTESNLKQFRYLGSINGKSYMLEESSQMNWSQAWDYCKEYDISLAAIETREQRDFLMNAMANTNINRTTNSFWLDAQQYSWVGNGARWSDSANMIYADRSYPLRSGLPPRSTYDTLCGLVYVGLSLNGSIYAIESATVTGRI